MRRLLILDCDGTAVDTLTDVALSFNQALRYCGFPEHPVEAYGGFVGGNRETVVSKLLPEGVSGNEPVDRVKTRYREIYAQSEKPNTAPYPGMLELLTALKAEGYTLAINSNKAQSLTEALVERLFPAGMFSSVVAYEESRPSKPDPCGVDLICRECGMNRQDAVYIGDGRSDVLTAKNAGIPCVFVTWGQGSQSECEAYDRCVVAKNMEELGQLLRNME